MQWREQGNTKVEQAPAGTHVARCVRVIDLGTHDDSYDGKPKRKRLCVVAWELPHNRISEGPFAGNPFVVSKWYTQSLRENSNLRHDLEAWRGKDFTAEELEGFAPRKMLGAVCMLALVHTRQGKANVKGVMAVPKGLDCPPATHPLQYFSLDEEFDQAAFDQLSGGYKRKIEASPEYRRIVAGGEAPPASSRTDDDIPF